MNPRPITILLADDDADDRQMAREALEESRLMNDFRWVEDGEALIDYLRRRGRYAAPDAAPVRCSARPAGGLRRREHRQPHPGARDRDQRLRLYSR